MERKFLEKIISLLKEGVDNYNFNSVMFSNYDEWKDINYVDVLEIVNEIKYDGLGLYTFLPFCYKFLGINVFFYLEEKNKLEWNDPKIEREIASFDNYVKRLLKVDIVFGIKKYNLNFSILKKIRDKLLSQGAIGVEKVEILEKGYIDYNDLCNEI